jgi:hypothetical protein
MALSRIPDRSFFGTCIKSVYPAEPANATDICLALFERDEATIGTALPTVISTPLIRFGGDRPGNERNRDPGKRERKACFVHGCLPDEMTC